MSADPIELDAKDEQPAIDDLLSLHKAMRKLQTVRSRIEENEATAKHEHELIDEWLHTATERDRRDAAFWEGQITAYALRRRQETKGRDKSLTGPHGRVETRELPTEYVYDDALLLPWAETHGFAVTHTETRIDKAGLRKRVIPHMAGTVLLEGEEVPGLTHRVREPAVEIHTWE